MYRDVRAAVDLCHRDGSLKRHVAANPAKYIHDVRHTRAARVPPVCCFWMVLQRGRGWRRRRAYRLHLPLMQCVPAARHRLPCRSVPKPPISPLHVHASPLLPAQDPHLVSMLQMYKRSGRKLFLATNSLWDYTNVVMNYLVR